MIQIKAVTIAAFSIFAFVVPYAEGRAKIFCLFAARAFISGSFQAAYVYTPEVYPTSMRAVSLGACRYYNNTVSDLLIRNIQWFCPCRCSNNSIHRSSDKQSVSAIGGFDLWNSNSDCCHFMCNASYWNKGSWYGWNWRPEKKKEKKTSTTSASRGVRKSNQFRKLT